MIGKVTAERIAISQLKDVKTFQIRPWPTEDAEILTEGDMTVRLYPSNLSKQTLVSAILENKIPMKDDASLWRIRHFSHIFTADESGAGAEVILPLLRTVFDRWGEAGLDRLEAAILRMASISLGRDGVRPASVRHVASVNPFRVGLSISTVAQVSLDVGRTAEFEITLSGFYITEWSETLNAIKLVAIASVPPERGDAADALMAALEGEFKEIDAQARARHELQMEIGCPPGGSALAAKAILLVNLFPPVEMEALLLQTRGGPGAAIPGIPEAILRALESGISHF